MNECEICEIELKQKQKEIRNGYNALTKHIIKDYVQKQTFYCSICQRNIKSWGILIHKYDKKHKAFKEWDRLSNNALKEWDNNLTLHQTSRFVS